MDRMEGEKGEQERRKEVERVGCDKKGRKGKREKEGGRESELR